MGQRLLIVSFTERSGRVRIPAASWRSSEMTAGRLKRRQNASAISAASRRRVASPTSPPPRECRPRETRDVRPSPRLKSCSLSRERNPESPAARDPPPSPGASPHRRQRGPTA